MARQTINVGTNQDDGTGDLLRDAFVKVNTNFTELYNEIGGDSLSNLKFAGNTISTDNTNANLILNPNGTGILQIEGSSLTTGDATVNGSVTVSSNLLVTGTSTLTGNTTIAGTLGVTSATTLSSTLAVTGASTFTGTVNTTGLLNAGNIAINGNTISSTAGVDLNITPLTGQQIVLDGTIVIDAGVVTGATSITSTAFVGTLTGNVTGNVSGTAATVTSVAQSAITSLGTLTTLSVDNITIDGNTISSTDSNGNINLTPNATGKVIASTLRVTDLTGGNRVVYAATSGALTTSSTLTFDGTTLALTGAMTLDNLTIDGNTISTTSGDIILNPSLGTVSTSTRRITQVGEPTSNSDAATKNYVDTRLANGFNVAVDDSSATIIGNGETLQIKGSGVTTSITGDTVTITATLATVTAGGATTTAATSFNGGLTANTFTVDSITINDNNITTNVSNADLILNPNGTGKIVADGHVRLTLQSGDPTADTSSGYIYTKTDTNTEVHVMDGAGNVTKISPHNNSGEWEYFSRNVNTGKVVRVNMERMIRKLEEITGEQFIEEE